MSQPGEIDPELKEFWVGNPFDIFLSQNLSSYERNRLFLNTGDGRFVDVSFSAGMDTDSDGRCSIPMDIDNDGMLDLILRQAGGGPLVIMRNTFSAANYLQVTLRGTDSNRQGIGSRLTARIGSQRVVREVYPVNTYRSQRPLTAHIGLSSAEQVDQLSIRWPSGTEQSLTDIQANQHILVTEGADSWVKVVPGQPVEP
ncbi:MAG: CRTAC1 family protein [Planctomycetaceae bacterium]